MVANKNNIWKNKYKCCLNPSDTLAVYMLLNCELFLCSVTTSFSFGWLVYKHCWSPSLQYYILISPTAALSHSESIWRVTVWLFGRKINLWISPKINTRRPAMYDIVLGRYLSNNYLLFSIITLTCSEKKVPFPLRPVSCCRVQSTGFALSVGID